ncbi:MAG: RNA-binding domain-containing protein [Candidatus Njordarchaeia archaeon]
MDINELLSLISQGEGLRIEFKRSPNTSGIAETVCSFLNTEGGYIVIGVDDKGRITGVDPKEAMEKISSALGAVQPHPRVDVEKIRLDDKYVFVVRVGKSDKIHTYRNRVYVRIGGSNRPLSLEEIIEKASEALILKFDELPSNAPLSAIDRELVEEYLDKRMRIRGIPRRGSYGENLKLLKIVVEKKGEIVPSNAGLLFFSRMPQNWIPQSKVHLVWFADEEARRYTDARFFEGPLWKIVNDIEEYFMRNLKRIGGELIGWKRTEILEYPIRALREAVTNAIIHRNYFDPSEVKIFVYPNKITIRNPGGFPPGVTVSDPVHKPRNPLLAQYMYDIGYIEKYGYGIKMMIEECEKHPLVKISFKIRPYLTEVIFTKEQKPELIDELDKKIIQLLKEEGEMSSGEIAKKTSKTKPTIIKRLKKLEALGLIEPKGTGPTRKYKIKPI